MTIQSSVVETDMSKGLVQTVALRQAVIVFQ